ncbi:MAG: mechanosensitive ion channel family protein [Thermodesulfobacteriota bacterium]|nr:mechanosensitive ion channel family protein [Thermodesulfobacteriota bacterium]
MEEKVKAMETVVNRVVDFFVNYSFQIVGAVLVLIVGVLVARAVSSFIFRLLEKKDFDVTLSKFTAAGVKGTILGFAILVALGKFGITIAPFVAAVAAMAFGASFAIQGPLSNYGAGLAIIVTRPFVVGNTITVAGVSGVVEEVKLGATVLTDEDGVRITIPNKHIIGEILHNSEGKKIVEEMIRVGYDSDPEEAIKIIRAVLGAFQEISKNPPPQVGIQVFGDSAINIGLRYWIPTKKYFQILYQANLAVFKALREGNIRIAFPQRDVHIVSESQNLSSTVS